MTEPADCNKRKRGGSRKSLSHSLSWALRHAAPTLGLTMSSDGFVPIDEILACNHKKLRGSTISIEDIQDVVATNDKRRFKIQEFPGSKFGRDEDTILCIRANQGHSIKGIDPDSLMTRLSPEELALIPVIVHGTYLDPWNAIKKEGLRKMNRTHIHFASGLPKDDGVISGMRRSCTVLVFIDAAKCAEHGITFYRSDNGVLLTAGVDDTGLLPTDFFLYVSDSTGKILLENRKAT